ncbi:PQQ-dependent sugar dehydrogenase [Halomicrobium katesii]|uniref:PQQ-dependent sugar dehydrogenase n=1 Tax=Halomicrobium katesii TaxID=437163 RepID=UPI00037B5C07|nr:PQQ-dependent sugar dehydrogenase [Halomicrobium katesii]
MGGNRASSRGIGRRRFLRRSGAIVGVGLVAGCTGSNPNDGTRTTSEGGTDTPAGPAALGYDLSVAHELTEWDRYDPDWEPPSDSPREEYTAEVLATGLEVPWDLSFAGEDTLFVTERTGRVTEFDSGTLRTVAEPSDVIDAAAIEAGSDESRWRLTGGEGGLLGVAAHPSYPDPPVVYVYYTAETSEGKRNRVVAFDASAPAPDETVVPVVDEIPADTYHNGGRIAFGPADYLWITTGDADPGLEHTEQTRDPASLAGTVLRVRPDGSPPPDNPDSTSDADPRVFTYGHRNPQGIDWLPDGTPIVTEHGPGAGDELNVLRPGVDYGWPVVRNSGDHERYPETEFQSPVADASSWAPAGGVFYTGESVPSLRNRFVFGGLISQRVTAATITPADGPQPADGHERHHDASWYDADYRAGTSGLLSEELGRVRHVEQGPEGDLYAITSNRDGRANGPFPRDDDDRLVRIRPA